jgi:hypothetical protein
MNELSEEDIRRRFSGKIDVKICGRLMTEKVGLIGCSKHTNCSVQLLLIAHEFPKISRELLL